MEKTVPTIIIAYSIEYGYLCKSRKIHIRVGFHDFKNHIFSKNLPFDFFTFWEDYRVSHSKVSKVILLWWGYRFQFLLIFWILWVHGIGAFMPKSSVFIFLMLRALYGSISENLLFLNEFLFILTFSSLFRVIRSKKNFKNIHFYFKLKVENKKASKNIKKY